MISLDIFGQAASKVSYPDLALLIRHGFNSNHVPFAGIEAAAAAEFPGAKVDNSSYVWSESVLYNGTKLAWNIWNNFQKHDIVLIGHSMGGLVCRVANAILCDEDFRTVTATLALSLGYAHGDVHYFQSRGFPKAGKLANVKGLVTLATPNSGAMLQGQVSGMAAAVHGFLQVFPPTRVSSVADLTSSRLFELLESAQSSTPVLTISGSYFNRFTLGAGQLTSWLGLGGINLDYPHDGIVEDKSVDLNESILANELTHRGGARGMHLRAYETCSNVKHTDIYDNYRVRDYVWNFIRRL